MSLRDSDDVEDRFLIIGAAGLVGSHIRLELGRQRVVATYRRRPPPGGVVLDITDHAAVIDLVAELKPRVIILAAADAYVERCEREPDVTRRVNVDAPRVVAEAAKEIDALLVVFSSEYVFDGTAGRYTEHDRRRPINEYGRQKVELEDIALGTGNGLVCRTSGVFGLDIRAKNFVLQLRDALREGRPFTVPSDQLITPTYAPWLAKAVVALARMRRTGTFHVAGPRIMSRSSFAEVVAAAYGLPRTLIVARPTSELGLTAPRPLRAGLAVTKLRGLQLDEVDPETALRAMAARDVTVK
jgi:dTDP-4-dehydrorhamnose reductase